MIWFTADTHFGHANVLKFTDRHERWDTVEDMDRGLVANINACVGPRDHLYILGDFSFKLDVDGARRIRERIACEHVHLVPGNHDKDWSVPALAGTFEVEPPILTLKDRGRKFELCHYPIVDWRGLGYGAIHLHGHIHAPAAYNEWNRANRMLRYDVGMDANGYLPVSVAQVLDFFKGVQPRPRVTREQWLELARGTEPAEADALLPKAVAPTAAELDGEGSGH